MTGVQTCALPIYIPEGKAPKYEELVDLSFADEAIKELGEWKGPICPSEQ